jgi:hypothetical protein
MAMHGTVISDIAMLKNYNFSDTSFAAVGVFVRVYFTAQLKEVS